MQAETSDADQLKPRIPSEEGGHSVGELSWIRRFEFLKQNSYLLRPRYRPGWTHPWKDRKSYDDWEDSIVQEFDYILDATRISDGQLVMLKLVPSSSPEVKIGEYLRSGSLRQDSRNHATPITEMLKDPFESDHTILVTPLLRRLDDPNPASVRECVDFVEQTLEVQSAFSSTKLQLTPRSGSCVVARAQIAHRDCTQRNILLDGRALFPSGWHPQAIYRLINGTYNLEIQSPSRTAVGGVRYYFIDFGISTLGEDLTVGFDGLERAPELSDDVPYNPYKLDVYVLGMTYREYLVQVHPEMAILQPLIDYMTPEAPKDRPTVDEAIQKFHAIRVGWGRAILSQRLRPAKSENIISRLLNDTKYRVNDLWWTQTAKPPVLPPFV